MKARVMVALVAAMLSTSCAGHSGSRCSTTAECASGLACVGPDAAPSCGIAPRRQCTATTDCPAGEQCHAVADVCSPSGIGSQCDGPCSASSCNPGLRCNAQGACEPTPCDQGFGCPSFERCDPSAAAAAGPVWSRTQGCVAIACSADANCPALAACVNGACQSGAGRCTAETVVP